MSQLPTHYPSSKGLKPITGMVTEHIQNALAKLKREGGDEATASALKAELTKRGVA